jgi:hypothetical protein
MSLSAEELPKLPRLDLDGCRRVAIELHRGILSGLAGSVLTAEKATDLVSRLIARMGLSGGGQIVALTDTINKDLGRRLNLEDTRRMAWQLAANEHRLLAGVSLSAFTGVTDPEWIPFEILSVGHAVRFGHLLAILGLLVIGGRSAGHLIKKCTPVGCLTYMAYQLGFSRRHRYVDPSDLVDLQFYGWVTPSTKEDLSFEAYACSSRILTRNKNLIKNIPREDVDEQL